MSVQILYNNKDVFSGISTVPFVGFSQEFIDFKTQWNQITNITLEGQLTGKYLGELSYNYLNESVQKLFNGFSTNFGSLQIKDNDNVIYSANSAIIDSINIEESNWYGLLPYNINIIVYDQELFTSYYGVIDPQEKFSFSDENGDIVNLTHTVSAKGIAVNGQNAITNAKNWVSQRTSNYNKIQPILVKKDSKNYLLQKVNEIVDRINGSYTWEGTYVKSVNPENPNNCLLNYTVELSLDVNDGFTVAKINGNLKSADINTLRSEYNNLNLFSICNDICSSTFNKTLSSRILSETVTEEPNTNSLNFSATFNDDLSPNVINNYNIDINNNLLKCIITARLSANLSCKYGDIKKRWREVKDFYNSQFNPYSLVVKEYNKESLGKKLNETPVTESIVFNEYDAQISYNAEFTDKKISLNKDILSLTSNLTLTPSIDTHIAKTSAFTPREHNIQNLKSANRTSLQISVTSIAKINKDISIAEQVAREEIDRIKSIYIGNKLPILENRNISKNNDIKTVTINETWTYEGDILS